MAFLAEAEEAVQALAEVVGVAVGLAIQDRVEEEPLDSTANLEIQASVQDSLAAAIPTTRHFRQRAILTAHCVVTMSTRIRLRPRLSRRRNHSDVIFAHTRH